MNQSKPRPKVSQEVAAQMIAKIIRERLPSGTDLGTEAELLDRLGVARGTLREALRQLEWHGVVRMQRGIGGGLRVAKPGSYVPMFALKVYFELARIDQLLLRRTLRLVQSARENPLNAGGNRVLELLEQSVDGQFVAAFAARGDRQGKLSEGVAYRLTMEIEDRDLVPGDCIGSEADLLARTAVGRGVLREALSLMALNKVIELRRGAAGGVYVHNPSPQFTIYVACVYLALADVGEDEIVGAQNSLISAREGGVGPLAGGSGGDGDLVTRSTLLAETSAATSDPVWAVFMGIFARYWREFHPHKMQGAVLGQITTSKMG